MSADARAARWRKALAQEMAGARAADARADRTAAFAHLERAHVLAQTSAFAHVRVHWAMLRWAWRVRDAREFRGQCVRVLLAAPSTWLRMAPRGNTGGANVPLRAALPLPRDLAEVLGEGLKKNDR